MEKRGPLCVLACYVLWGLLPIFWKTLSAVDARCVLANRIVWSLVFIALLALRKGGWAAIRKTAANRRELGRLALSGCFICINWGLYIWAVNSGRVLDASLAYYMNPVLSIVLGRVLFGERQSKLQMLAVGVTLAGICVTVAGYGDFPWIALCIGGSFTLYGVIKKGVESDAVTSTFFETLLLAPFALCVLCWLESRGSGAVGVLHGWQWLLLPLSGVVTTVPLLLFSKGVQSTPMSLSGILMYVNPTLQMLLSVLLYGEAFTASHAVLFGFVWSGLALYLLSSVKRSRAGEKEDASCV